MKRAVILTVLGLLVLGVGIVSAQTPSCSRTGTPARDVMAGTSARDIICSLGGDDYVHGGGGSDLLRGGDGKDVLVAGKGADRLQGEAGEDRLFVVDDRGGDKAIGGGGFDQCFVDQGDTAKGCERVFRGHSITPRQYLALQSAFFGGLTLAEDLITTGSPSPVPSIVTVTKTIPFPPCDNQDPPSPVC